jgi:serine/threonine protein kinase
MFRVPVENRFVVDLGELDPWQFDGIKAEVLRELIKGSPYLARGKHHVSLKIGNTPANKYALTLKAPMTYRGVFDPSEINQANQSYLDTLLMRAYANGVCLAGLQCMRNPESKSLELYDLRYTIIPRQKSPQITYYDLIGSGVVGEGSFGVVRPIVGTIKPRFGNVNDLYFSPSENKRVVKVLTDYSYDKRNLKIENEARMMRLADNFKVRDTHQYEDSEYCRVHVISMKRFPWVGLHRIIKMDRNNQITLTIDDRLQITINMLRELKRRLHDKHILHRDIKSENIHVNKDKITRYWEINFIDLGLSTTLSEASFPIVGTPFYLSPELLSGDFQSKASDLYALARVIGEVWRDKELKSLTNSTRHIDGFMEKRSIQKNINFRLFDGIDMPASLKNDIELIIRSLSSFEKNERPDIADAIRRFEAVRLNYALLNLPEDAAQKIQAAHKIAMALSDMLENCAQNSSEVSVGSVDKFKAMIEDHVNLLPDHAKSIQMFTVILGIKCLHGCVSKADILLKLAKIFNCYFVARDDCFNGIRNLDALLIAAKEHRLFVPGLTEYHQLCQKFNDNLNKNIILDLDKIVEDTKKFKTKTKDVNEAVHHYKHVIDNLLSARRPSKLSLGRKLEY